MKPLKNYIVVGEVAVEKQTSGGIILTQEVVTGSKPAKVIAVGPDVSTVSVGDLIAIKWAESLPVTENGSQFAIISEEFVYAIF